MSFICFLIEDKCAINMFDQNFCQRKGDHVFYSVGGTLCNSQHQNNKCTIKKVVIATRFANGRSMDTKGLWYEPDLDPWKHWSLTSDLWIGRSSIVDAPFVPFWDKLLYREHAEGNFIKLPTVDKTDRDGCAIFSDTLEDGSYEISIKLLDHLNYNLSAPYKRYFNVILNGIYIAREFNPNSYRQRGYGVELVVNFQISNASRILVVQGYPKSFVNRERKLNLEICYSFCARIGYVTADPNWMMNSISIVKFAR